MKKLIIYDESCPMCKLYTKGMVAADTTGCLTRIGSGQLTQDTINRIDPQRARHEIPLVDLDGGETLYGVDTWIYALGQRNRQVENLLSMRWFKTILQKLYAFISYNRRIIITSAPGRWQLFDLQPEFQLSYRIAFILVVFGLLTGLFVTVNFPVWAPAVVTLIAGQLIITSLYLFNLHDDNFLPTLLDYTGHLGMSLLMGGLVGAIGLTTGWSALLPIGYAIMIGQHFIRTYRLGLNPWLSVCFTVLFFLLLGPL
ncbi:hypothetical protein BH09BAC4_BH09BAC4_09960 [soil metagenome]